MARCHEPLEWSTTKPGKRTAGDSTLNLTDSVHDSGEESVADPLRDLNNALINHIWWR
ncbi:MAG: hypothetical protein COB33_011085 [Thiotrichaceae bacterium]|nr:hypothetical protein [Thiotrichaceae bacterium]